MIKEKAMTLLQLNGLVRQALEITMPNEYWVETELSEVRESRGHCYMELIEKDETSNTPIAKASAKCWRQTWAVINPYFTRATGQTLHAGMKVLIKVYPQFHEAYGFSWIISDIDPTYTIGDMARKRQEIIRKLKEEGVLDLNKELEIPMFAQRIAVISSETAAGYGDFCNQLADNEYGFAFTMQLFAAIMQGEQVEQSIISALNKINDRLDDFDCVVIIRGGGGTSDMSGFDTLALAENVANFPLPIITGIGHDRDESVLDLVSNTHVKTPTAAAAMLISNLKTVADRIDYCKERITTTVSRIISGKKQRIDSLAERIPSLFSVVKTRQEARLDMMFEHFVSAIERKIVNEKHRMDMLTQRTSAVDPMLILKRGYSITMINGKSVRNANALKQDDEIETRLEQGTIKSRII